MVVTNAARIMNNKTESPMIKFKQPSKKTSTKDDKDNNVDVDVDVNDNVNINVNVNNNNKKNTKKRVKFSPTVFVETTISLYDMTGEEIEKTWNSIEEENDIRRRCRELMAAAAAACEDESDNEYSNNSVEMRGLENIKQRRSNRCIAQEEVFEEQDQQNLPYCFGNGNGGYFLNDDEKIASVYKMHTTKCTISARLMAIKDRIEIENYLLFCNN